MTVSEDGTVTPSGIALQYDNGNITAYFRRNDVLQVSKTVVASTAYIVSKDSGSTVGYVATEGDTGAYVAADTPVYSNQEMTTLLENAAADTWTYSGESANNTETTTGYVKEGSESSNFVPPSTQVYTDANCTTPQAVTTGTDYVYDNVSAVSMIGTLTTAYSDTITMGFNGTQYTLGTQTLTSSDNIKGGCNITLGGAPDVSSAITGINLNTSVFSFWQWNGSTLETPSYLPFVGAKIGEIKDSNGLITSTKIDTPLALADSSLSNLTEEGEKHFLNKSQITNCLLEVPQRVKLTFDNDQGLVLHAGSEVIVPYGKGTPTMQIGDALNGGVISDVQVVGDDNKIFYYITYNSDIVLGKTIGTGGNTYWLYVTPEGTISGDVADDIYSQAAQPTGISESVIWYDTTNNYVKVTLDTGSSWTQGNSLLIGRLNRTGTGTITSVRDIYNGVGVIGSNIWVDKDVVYCTPAGRNPDGSLKNNIGRINNFTIYSTLVSGTHRFLFLNPFESQNNSANHQGVFWDIGNYFISEDLLYQKRATASGSQYGILYRPSENLFYWSSIQNPNWTVFPEGLVFLGALDHDSTRGNDSDGYPVISFGTRQALPFKALNYYDRLYIGNLSSIGAFTNVAFGASGTQYIAPFDGWFYAQKVSGISGGYIQCVNETKYFFDESKAWDSNTTLAASVPVSNGDLCTLNYTATGGRAYLRFYTINALYQ